MVRTRIFISGKGRGKQYGYIRAVLGLFYVIYLSRSNRWLNDSEFKHAA